MKKKLRNLFARLNVRYADVPCHPHYHQVPPENPCRFQKKALHRYPLAWLMWIVCALITAAIWFSLPKLLKEAEDLPEISPSPTPVPSHDEKMDRKTSLIMKCLFLLTILVCISVIIVKRVVPFAKKLKHKNETHIMVFVVIGLFFLANLCYFVYTCRELYYVTTPPEKKEPAQSQVAFSDDTIYMKKKSSASQTHMLWAVLSILLLCVLFFIRGVWIEKKTAKQKNAADTSRHSP